MGVEMEGAALRQMSAILGEVALGRVATMVFIVMGICRHPSAPKSFSDSLRKGQSSFFPCHPEHLAPLPALLPRPGPVWTPCEPASAQTQAGRQAGRRAQSPGGQVDRG